LKPPTGFTFGLLSDRTGLARPGVFEHAVEVLNWLRPDFVIQIGDVIEGYTTDEGVLSAEWEEAESMLDLLEVPLFRVVGNHDVSNDVMRSEWQRRHGLLYYHFRFDDVLFLIMDTCDPPQALSDFGGEGDNELTPQRLDELRALRESDPDALRRQFESMADWDSTMPAQISGRTEPLLRGGFGPAFRCALDHYLYAHTRLVGRRASRNGPAPHGSG
jgi:hypothetical protein